MTKNEHQKVSKAIDTICNTFEEHGGADREEITDMLFEASNGAIDLEEAVKENM